MIPQICSGAFGVTTHLKYGNSGWKHPLFLLNSNMKGSSMLSTEEKKLVKQVFDLLSDRSKWCQGAGARTEDKNICSPLSEKACSWCVFGAFYKFVGGCPTINPAFVAINSYVISANPNGYDIVSINDNEGYDKVMQILRKFL